jgi:hypothetical protein
VQGRIASRGVIVLKQILRRGPKRLWIVVILFAVAGVCTAAAVQQTVTISAHWRVLPYQVLQLIGANEETSAAAGAPAQYTIPAPTAADRERGFIEDEYAFRFRIVSNTSWKLQVASTSPSALDAQLRRHGGAYATVSGTPLVLASGANGSFEVGVDVRISLSDGVDFSSVGDSLGFEFTLMSQR